MTQQPFTAGPRWLVTHGGETVAWTRTQAEADRCAALLLAYGRADAAVEVVRPSVDAR